MLLNSQSHMATFGIASALFGAGMLAGVATTNAFPKAQALVPVNDGMCNSISSAIQTITSATQQVTGLIKGVQDQISSAIGPVMQLRNDIMSTIGQFTAAIDQVKNLPNQLMQNLNSQVGNIIGQVNNMMRNVQNLPDTLIAQVQGKLEGMQSAALAISRDPRNAASILPAARNLFYPANGQETQGALRAMHAAREGMVRENWASLYSQTTASLGTSGDKAEIIDQIRDRAGQSSNLRTDVRECTNASLLNATLLLEIRNLLAMGVQADAVNAMGRDSALTLNLQPNSTQSP